MRNDDWQPLGKSQCQYPPKIGEESVDGEMKKYGWIVTTNKCTKYVLYINLKTLFYTKTLGARVAPCWSHELKLYTYHYWWCGSISCIGACVVSVQGVETSILIRDCSMEQHELPEDDKQLVIETSRSLLSIFVQRILD
jgi:hypothetical protein